MNAIIHTGNGFEYWCSCGLKTTDLDNYKHHICNLMMEHTYNIPNASIQKIIGIESMSTGETYHHITILITAKHINPDDYKNLPTKGNVELKI